MKLRRLQYKYRQSASALHKKVGDTLRSSPTLQSYRIYQEYPVNLVNTKYESAREHFDWVIKDLYLVIECHGEQHYKPVTFGGISDEEALANFQGQQLRDAAKKQAALDAGYSYITIPFTDQKIIDELYVLSLIQAAPASKLIAKEETEELENKWRAAYARKKEWLATSGLAEQQKLLAKKLRKEAYQKAKAQKKARSKK